MNIRILFIAFITIIVFPDCTPPEKYSNIYVGGYRIFDQFHPCPFLIEDLGDKMIKLDNKLTVIDSLHSNIIRAESGDTIIGNESQYEIVFNRKDIFSILDLSNTISNFKLASVYNRAKIYPDCSKEKLSKTLENNIWEFDISDPNPNKDLSIKTTLLFSNNVLTTLREYSYINELIHLEKETKHFHIQEYKGLVFLCIEDRDKPKNLLPIYQVKSISENEIKLINFRVRLTEELSLVKQQINKSKYLEVVNKAVNFKRCYDGFQGEYYANDDTTFKKGNQWILKNVQSNAPKTNKDGYINFHYTVNCNGHLGHFGLEQMDRSFEPISYEPEFVKHIFDKIKTLNEYPKINPWHPDYAYNEDVHGFLMFKTESGKITDICP